MLDAEELYILSDRLVEIFDELNKTAITDMALRIMEMQELGIQGLPGTAAWLSEVTNQMGVHYRTMITKISQITSIASEELEQLFKDTGIKSLNNDIDVLNDYGFKIDKIADYENISERNKQIIQTMYERTDSTMINFTGTTAKASETTLYNILDKAYTEVKLGYKSYNQAIAEAVDTAAKSGQVMVVYGSGHKDTIETAVRRAVLTGVNQTSGQTGARQAIEMGVEYVIISSHLGARMSEDNPIADHYGWQGKVYKLEGSNKEYGNLLEKTGFDYKGENSDPLGLFGYNCRHSMFPYILGTPNPFIKYGREENKERYEYNSKKRALERDKRKLSNAISAYDAAIKECKDDSIKMDLQNRKAAARELLKKKNKEYNDLLFKNDIKSGKIDDEIIEYNNSLVLSDRQMYQLGAHYNKHGRHMGFDNKKEYQAGAKEFFDKYIIDETSKIYEGKWNGKGTMNDRIQIALQNEGKTLVIDKETKQMVDYYVGTNIDGIIFKKKVKICESEKEK